MKKEVIYAIIAGGLLGLLIAYGAWRVNSALSSKDKKPQNTEQKNVVNSTKISIASPSNFDVVTDSPAVVSGLARVGSLVIVSGEETDALASADNKGSFASEIELTGGVNAITAGFFDDKGNFDKQTIEIVYSTEFAKITPPPMPSDNPSSSDSVRQKVQDKIKEAYNNPIAYLGTVTDKSETGLQIKTAEGAIEQISTTEEPVVVKSGKTLTEVKLTDLAIGDYIVAMGFTGNHVLTAKRILITSPNEISSRTYMSGKVLTVTKKDLTLISEKDEKEIIVLVGADTDIYLRETDKVTKSKLGSIGKDDDIYVIGKLTNDKLTARTIFIIGQP